MSLQGETTAFISIGIACQTSHQLNLNRDALSACVGEPLRYRSSFFNWVMVGANDIGRTLDRLVAAPITAQSLRIPAAPMRCPTLSGHNVWFWHEKPSHEILPRMVEIMAGKYEHLRQNFLDLCRRPDRYFVLGNAQNNCAWQEPHLYEGMQLGLDDAVLRDIGRTLDRLFRHGRNHLITIARRDRLAPAMHERVSLVDDDTEWEGSSEAWHEALLDWFARQERHERIVPVRASTR